MGYVAKIAALTHCCFKVTENLICHAHLLVGQCVEKFPSHLEEIVCSYSSSNVSHTGMHIFQCTFFYQCIIFFCCAILFTALLSFIKAMELPVFSSWYTLAVTCPFFALSVIDTLALHKPHLLVVVASKRLCHTVFVTVPTVHQVDPVATEQQDSEYDKTNKISFISVYSVQLV